MSPRALLYLRQSDTDNEGEHSLSLDSQSRVLRQDGERLGWAIVAEIRDPDFKGHDEKRPGLLELYERCRSGSIDLVAFWSLDRLARSLRIQENVVWELERLNVAMYSNQESWIAEPMLRQIVGSVNEQRTRDISAHVRRALRENALRGIHHGPPPFGYRLTDERRLVPSEDARIVEEMFQLRASGLSWAQMAEALERRGIRSPKGFDHWAEVSVRQIVINPAYRGALARNGTIIEQTHEPIISEELWHDAHARRFPRARAPRRKDDGSWLEGLINHGCGYPMYSWRGAGRTHRLRCSSLTHRRHLCAVTPNSAMVPLLERLTWEAITEDLARVQGMSVAQVIKAARRHEQERRPAADAHYFQAAGKRDRAMARRALAEDLYLSGRRDRTWFDVEEAKCATDLDSANAVLTQIPAPPSDETLRRQIDALRVLARDSGLISTPTARATMLRTLGVAVFDGQQVRIQYRPEWAVVFESVVAKH